LWYDFEKFFRNNQIISLTLGCDGHGEKTGLNVSSCVEKRRKLFLD